MNLGRQLNFGRTAQTVDTDPVALVARWNALVTGEMGTGKTAAFGVPLVRGWQAPVIIFATSRTHGYGEVLRDRAHLGRFLTIDLDTLLAADANRPPALPDLSNTDPIGTLLVTTRAAVPDVAARLVAALTAALRSWIAAARESPSETCACPLMVVDDYWTYAQPLLDGILASFHHRDRNRVRLVVITQSIAACRAQLDRTTVEALSVWCRANVAFTNYDTETARFLNIYPPGIRNALTKRSLRRCAGLRSTPAVSPILCMTFDIYSKLDWDRVAIAAAVRLLGSILVVAGVAVALRGPLNISAFGTVYNALLSYPNPDTVFVVIVRAVLMAGLCAAGAYAILVAAGSALLACSSLATALLYEPKEPKEQ